jgi:phosphatidylcholine synthase
VTPADQGLRAKILAWLVHGYTALGLVLAAIMAVLIVEGSDASFRMAFLLMGLAMAVDATDGWLARRARVARVLPSIDGRRLDDIIDFHTYTSLPLFLLWRAEFLEGPMAWVLLVPLLASAYGFSRVDAKTDDGFFLGFPSYWNVVAFYLWFLVPGSGVTAAVIVAFSVLTLIPIRYLAPSRPGPLSATTNILGGLWGIAVILFLLDPGLGQWWLLATLAYPAYYMGASWVLSARLGRRR